MAACHGAALPLRGGREREGPESKSRVDLDVEDKDEKPAEDLFGSFYHSEHIS